MWTGIIAAIAFFLGFFLSSLVACAKAAGAEMEMTRKTASSRDDHRREETGRRSGRRVISATGAGRSPGRNSNGTGMRPGCLPMLDNDRRVETK